MLVNRRAATEDMICTRNNSSEMLLKYLKHLRHFVDIGKNGRIIRIYLAVSAGCNGVKERECRFFTDEIADLGLYVVYGPIRNVILTDDQQRRYLLYRRRKRPACHRDDQNVISCMI